MLKSDRVLIVLAIVITLFAGTAVASSAEGAFDRSFNVNGAVQLNIENSSGSINVARGSSSKVEVHATIKTNEWFGASEETIRRIEQNPPVEQRGNTIRISRVEDGAMFRHISIDYRITVPENTTIDSSTGSGSQTIDDVKGPVNVRTGSGSVHLSDIGASSQVHTGSGSVEVRGIHGGADLSTGSGSIRAQGVAGPIRAHAGSGHIDLDQAAPGNVEAETGSGHIEMHHIEGALRARSGSGSIVADGRPKSDWDIQSGSGSVDIHVPDDVGLDVDAHAGSGSVTVNHPITMQGAVNTNRHQVRGQIHGGGVRLAVTTSSGSIHIE